MVMKWPWRLPNTAVCCMPFNNASWKKQGGEGFAPGRISMTLAPFRANASAAKGGGQLIWGRWGLKSDPKKNQLTRNPPKVFFDTENNTIEV